MRARACTTQFAHNYIIAIPNYILSMVCVPNDIPRLLDSVN